MVEEWLKRLQGLAAPSGVKFKVHVDPLDLL